MGEGQLPFDLARQTDRQAAAPAMHVESGELFGLPKAEVLATAWRGEGGAPRRINEMHA